MTLPLCLTLLAVITVAIPHQNPKWWEMSDSKSKREVPRQEPAKEPPPSDSKPAREIKKPGYFSRARFVTHYDKFEDRTTILFRALPVTGSMRYAMSGEMLYLGGMAFYSGKVPDVQTATFVIYFESRSNDWKYLRGPELIALVDGERIRLSVAERDSKVFLGGVKEELYFKVEYETLLRVANGSQVEMKVGNRAFELKDNHLYALRELAARLTP